MSNELGYNDQTAGSYLNVSSSQAPFASTRCSKVLLSDCPFSAVIRQNSLDRSTFASCVLDDIVDVQ